MQTSGNGLTLAGYKAALTTTNAKLAAYNTRLSELDGILNELEAAEEALDALSSRMLAGVGVKFGKNTTEYESRRQTQRRTQKLPPRHPCPRPAAGRLNAALEVPPFPHPLEGPLQGLALA